MIADKPSRTSFPSKFLSFSFNKPYFRAYSLNVFVSPVLNPVSWVPPSPVLTRLTNESVVSWYPEVNCKAISASKPFCCPSIEIVGCNTSLFVFK